MLEIAFIHKTFAELFSKSETTELLFDHSVQYKFESYPLIALS